MNILGGMLPDGRRPDRAGRRRTSRRTNSREAQALGHRLHSSGTEPVPQSQRRGKPVPRPFSQDVSPACRSSTGGECASAPRRRSRSSISIFRRARRSAGLPQGERQLVEIAKALSREGAPHHLRRADDLADGARDRSGCSTSSSRLRAPGHRDHLHQPHPRRRHAALRRHRGAARRPGGRRRGRGPRCTIERMITLMVGRTIDQLFPERATGAGPNGAALSVRKALAAGHGEGHRLRPACAARCWACPA